MNRVAGMVVEGNRAALVVLVRDGSAWRVESVMTGPDLFDLAVCPVDCPIILDAAEWSVELAPGGPLYAYRLRHAGFDVRPPCWIEGRAANPPLPKMASAVGAIGNPAYYEDKARWFAYGLAAWGAVHSTSAEPIPPGIPDQFPTGENARPINIGGTGLTDAGQGTYRHGAPRVTLDASAPPGLPGVYVSLSVPPDPPAEIGACTVCGWRGPVGTKCRNPDRCKPTLRADMIAAAYGAADECALDRDADPWALLAEARARIAFLDECATERRRQKDEAQTQRDEAERLLMAMVKVNPSVPTGDGWSECHWCLSPIDEGKPHAVGCAWDNARRFLARRGLLKES